MQLKVTGLFDTSTHAENAQEYLLANGFTNGTKPENDEPVPHNTAMLSGCQVIIYSETSREAQEALDVLNNYGAVTVEIIENK